MFGLRCLVEFSLGKKNKRCALVDTATFMNHTQTLDELLFQKRCRLLQTPFYNDYCKGDTFK
jgi:hypothetical protein